MSLFQIEGITDLPDRPNLRIVADTPLGKKLLFRCWETDDGTAIFQFQPNAGVTDADHLAMLEHKITLQKWSIHPSDGRSYCTVVFTQEAGLSSQRSKMLLSELKNDTPVVLVSKRFSDFQGASQKVIHKTSQQVLSIDPGYAFLTGHIAVRRRGSTEVPAEANAFHQTTVSMARFDILFYSRIHLFPALRSSRINFAYYLKEEMFNYDESGKAVGIIAQAGAIISLEDSDRDLQDQFCFEMTQSCQDRQRAFDLSKEFLRLTGPVHPLRSATFSKRTEEIWYELCELLK